MSPEQSSSTRSGLIAAIAAYVLWGVFPLYFVLLAPASANEVVGFRVLMALVVCLLLLCVVRGGWRRFAALVRDRRTALLMLAAAAFIYVNWMIFILAALSGHVIESALGYFINPLVTVLLGVIVLREKVRPIQWIALAFAGLAFVVIAIGYGSFPWIALLLAFSFAAYGLIKRVVGPKVDAIGGLALETAWLAPLAVAQLLFVGLTDGLEFGHHGALHAALMLGSGLATAVPLLLFAAGARRIPLVAIGLTQFISPVLQFLAGWLILGEAMPLERWIGFGLVWLALTVLTVDVIRASRVAPDREGRAG